MPSTKIFEQKKAVVAKLTDVFKNAETIVLADYRGLTVEQDTEMRKALREAGVEYHVVKNRLARFAAEEAGLAEMKDMFVGPTAYALSDTDAVTPAKILKQYSDKFKLPVLKGGASSGRVLTENEIKELASVPDLVTLQTQLAYSLISPITKLAIALKAVADKDGSSDVEQSTEVVETASTEA